MTNLSSISSLGVASAWPSRRSVVKLLEKALPRPIDEVLAYNGRSDVENTLNMPPNSTYIPVGSLLRVRAEASALSGRPWEREMLNAIGFDTFGTQLYFFWHVKFRSLFPDHPRPLRMLNWESMTEAMAMAFILGCAEEGIYHGYLIHAALNRSYQLQLSYEERHRRVHSFMLRLFSEWRSDVRHSWPPFAYSEPIYEGILERWREPDPDVLKPWLLAACDRHTHESKRDSEGTFYDCAAFPRTPLEILYLFRLRELVGLANPELTHPLLEAPFDTLPAPQAAYVPDELIRGTLIRVREDWPDFDMVVSLESLRGR
ncbi:hypothetical protein [Trinickia symbiotica]|nr:hypothetical protein [Trinickia symbiotica]